MHIVMQRILIIAYLFENKWLLAISVAFCAQMGSSVLKSPRLFRLRPHSLRSVHSWSPASEQRASHRSVRLEGRL